MIVKAHLWPELNSLIACDCKLVLSLVVPSTRRQQLEQSVISMLRVCYNLIGPLPAVLDKRILHGRQLRFAGVLSDFYLPLLRLPVEERAAAGAAAQDTLNDAPVEAAAS